MTQVHPEPAPTEKKEEVGVQHAADSIEPTAFAPRAAGNRAPPPWAEEASADPLPGSLNPDNQEAGASGSASRGQREEARLETGSDDGHNEHEVAPRSHSVRFAQGAAINLSPIAQERYARRESLDSVASRVASQASMLGEDDEAEMVNDDGMAEQQPASEPRARFHPFQLTVDVNTVPDDAGTQPLPSIAPAQGASGGMGSLVLSAPESLPPLHKALWEGQTNTVYALLRQNPDEANRLFINPEPVPPQVSEASDPEKVLRALQNCEYLLFANTPLAIAAALGNKHILQKLLGCMKDVREISNPPPNLPEGCPWVTPLTAAALNGNPECVRLLSRKMGKAQVSSDKSRYGTYRFRPLCVAQSAGAVEILSNPAQNDKYDALRKLANKSLDRLKRSSEKLQRAATAVVEAVQHTNLAFNRLSLDESNGYRGSGDGAEAGTPLTPAVPVQGGLAAGLHYHPNQEHANASVAEAAQEEMKYDERSREQRLLRARVFSDINGRPLERALLSFNPASELALQSLASLLQAGLDPNLRTLDGRSTLLMTITSSYSTVLVRLGSSSPGHGGSGGLHGATTSRNLRAYLNSTGMASMVDRGQSFLVPQSPAQHGMMAAHNANVEAKRAHVQHLMDAVLIELLNHGVMPAAVDEEFENGLVGVDHQYTTPLDCAVATGPPELALMMLHHSKAVPRGHQAGVLAALNHHVGSSTMAHTSDRSGPYDKRPGGGEVVISRTHRPLLALAAKLDAFAQHQHQLPHWLMYQTNYTEFMEAMIVSSLERSNATTVPDLTWLLDCLDRFATQWNQGLRFRADQEALDAEGSSEEEQEDLPPMNNQHTFGTGSEASDVPAPRSSNPKSPGRGVKFRDPSMRQSGVATGAAKRGGLGASGTMSARDADRLATAASVGADEGPGTSSDGRGTGTMKARGGGKSGKNFGSTRQFRSYVQRLHVRTKDDGEGGASQRPRGALKKVSDPSMARPEHEHEHGAEADDDDDARPSTSGNGAAGGPSGGAGPLGQGSGKNSFFKRGPSWLVKLTNRNSVSAAPAANSPRGARSGGATVTPAVGYSAATAAATAAAANSNGFKANIWPQDEFSSDFDSDADSVNAEPDALFGPEENACVRTAGSMYRACADAIVELHQDNAPELRMRVHRPLLNLVSMIAAKTLEGASSISVFVASEAVSQLLYAQDWTAGPSMVSMELLKKLAKRHPQEAARLLYGIDLNPAPLDSTTATIPMSLPSSFYAVMVGGRAEMLEHYAAAHGGHQVQRAAASASLGRTMGDDEALRALPTPQAGKARPSAPSTTGTMGGGGGGAGVAGGGNMVARARDSEDFPTRLDLLQACVFRSMWGVLLHFCTVSFRLPDYLRTLEEQRENVYWYALIAYARHYGSVPVLLLWVLLLAVFGLMTRLLMWCVKLTRHGVYMGLVKRIRPTTDQVKQLGNRMMSTGRHIAATMPAFRSGNAATAAAAHDTQQAQHRGFSHRFRIMSRFSNSWMRGPLDNVSELLDPVGLTELLLGITGSGRKGGPSGSVSASGRLAASAAGAFGGRTTRVVCHRVPITYAAAMPSSLLYRLASSPNVNGELFASPMMRAIISFRWMYFTRYYLLLQLLEHLLLTAVFLTYAISLSYNPRLLSGIFRDELTTVFEREGCVLSPSPVQRGMLIIMAFLNFSSMVQEFRQMMFFKGEWFQQPWNLLDAASISINTVIISLHVYCNTPDTWLRGLASIQVLLLFLRLLYFAMAEDKLGNFFRMVLEVIRSLSLFFLFLGTIYFGFGLAMIVMEGEQASMRDTFMRLFAAIFDFQWDYLTNEVNTGSSGIDALYRVFLSVYQIMIAIILLNLLIAIINDSYDRVHTNETAESLRNKVTLIVEAESVLPLALVHRMLSHIGGKELYTVEPESAQAQSLGHEGKDIKSATQGDRFGEHRELRPPSQWLGRVGQTHADVTDFMARADNRSIKTLDKIMGVLHELRSGTSVRQVPGKDMGSGGAPSVGGASQGLTRASSSHQRLTSHRLSHGGSMMLGVSELSRSRASSGGGVAAVDFAEELQQLKDSLERFKESVQESVDGIRIDMQVSLQQAVATALAQAQTQSTHRTSIAGPPNAASSGGSATLAAGFGAARRGGGIQMHRAPQ